MLAAYFAGTHEGADDVAIYLSRRVEGVWLNPVKLAKVAEVAHWNPVLMPIPGGARLIFKVGRTIPEWEKLDHDHLRRRRYLDKARAHPRPRGKLRPGAEQAFVPLRRQACWPRDSVETTQSWRPRIDMSCDYWRQFPRLFLDSAAGRGQGRAAGKSRFPKRHPPRSAGLYHRQRGHSTHPLDQRPRQDSRPSAHQRRVYLPLRFRGSRPHLVHWRTTPACPTTIPALIWPSWRVSSTWPAIPSAAIGPTARPW